MVATGREASTSGLNLENAGVEACGHGKLKVDKHERTNVEHIYAVGDVLEVRLHCFTVKVLRANVGVHFEIFADKLKERCSNSAPSILKTKQITDR